LENLDLLCRFARTFQDTLCYFGHLRFPYFLLFRKQGDLDVKYDFSVLKADNSCWGRIGNTFKKFSPDQNSWGYGKAFSKAKLIEKQNELLPNGCLTIVCNLEIYYSDRSSQGKKPRLDLVLNPDGPNLGDQLAESFSGGEFTDVTLVCGEKRFPCHKVQKNSVTIFFKQFSQFLLKIEKSEIFGCEL
jgi:hypothetical protein